MGGAFFQHGGQSSRLKAGSGNEEQVPSSRRRGGGVKSADSAPRAGARARDLSGHLEGWQAGAVAVGSPSSPPRSPSLARWTSRNSPLRSRTGVRSLGARPKSACSPKRRDIARCPSRCARWASSSAGTARRAPTDRADRAARILTDLRDATKAAMKQHGPRAPPALARRSGRALRARTRRVRAHRQALAQQLDELGGNPDEEGGGERLARVRAASRSRTRREPYSSGSAGPTSHWLARSGPVHATLEDWRVYYEFLLAHPEGAGELDRLRSQFAYVTALAKRDSTYPVWLARGVLQYRKGALPEAAGSLPGPPGGASRRALRASSQELPAGDARQSGQRGVDHGPRADP